MVFKMPAQTQAILGEDRVTGVRFADGDGASGRSGRDGGRHPARTSSSRSKAGLHCERGIVVSDTMQTYDGRIYAVGECVQHRRQTYGLVAPLFDQAKVCANHLAMKGFATYDGSVVSTKLKVTGIDLFSAGDFAPGADKEEIVHAGRFNRGVYKRIILRDKKIIGAVLYGDTIDGPWYFQHLRDGTDVSQMRERLVFGAANLGDGGHSGQNSVAAMGDDAEICGCNGVCKGTIVKAISEKKLFTIDDVRAHTKASSSCGSCTGLVEQVLAFTLGGDYSAAPKVKPMCACTDHSHDDARRVIVEQNLKTIPDVMRFMDWKTPNGCHSCRPALNYYLLATWPGEYRDDQQSRYINERRARQHPEGRHLFGGAADVGGVTTPSELRAIADVADKFNIPTVKVTGGQRIDLLGVKKEDLPAVWADLNDAGMVSGHAYAKGLRTVKTCVGSEWCRFGTQDLDRPRHQDRKVHVGLVDAGQGEAGGVRLSAQLRRGDLQGCRRGLRRFRLRDPFRRRRRPSHQGNRVPGQGRDRGGDARSDRRADAALSRAGLVSGAHVQMVRSRRSRRHPQAGGRRCRQPQGACSAASPIRSNSRKAIRGRRARKRRRSQRVRADRRSLELA